MSISALIVFKQFNLIFALIIEADNLDNSEDRFLANFEQKYAKYLKTNKIFYSKIPHKRYTTIEKAYFINLFNKTKDASMLKIKYEVPKSSIRRMILDFKNNQEYFNNAFRGIQKNLNYQSELVKAIKNIVKPSTEPLTLNKISSKLCQLGTFHSKRIEIKTILKNDLKYSFKRGSFTTFNGG